MKFTDQFGRENNIPETDFENGRQDSLSDLETRVKMRIHFLLSIKDQEGITISKEIRDEQIKVYDDINGLIKSLKTKNADIQYFGKTIESNTFGMDVHSSFSAFVVPENPKPSNQ